MVCSLEYAVPAVVKSVLICVIWRLLPRISLYDQHKGNVHPPEPFTVNGENVDNDSASSLPLGVCNTVQTISSNDSSVNEK